MMCNKKNPIQEKSSFSASYCSWCDMRSRLRSLPARSLALLVKKDSTIFLTLFMMALLFQMKMGVLSALALVIFFSALHNYFNSKFICWYKFWYNWWNVGKLIHRNTAWIPDTFVASFVASTFPHWEYVFIEVHFVYRSHWCHCNIYFLYTKNILLW